MDAICIDKTLNNRIHILQNAYFGSRCLGAGLRNSEILKSQTNEYKFAAGRKSLFCSSLKKIPEQQLNVRSWATFSAIDKDLANRKKCFHKPYALREPYVE